MTKLIVEMTADERDFLLMALQMVRHETEHPTVAKTLRDAVFENSRKHPEPKITGAKVEAAAIAMYEDAYGEGDWVHREEIDDRVYRNRARVALEAAARALAEKTSVHEWQEISFSWGGFIECTCGYRPDSQAQMDAHATLPVGEGEPRGDVSR